MKYKTYTMEDALETIIDYRGKTPKKSDSGIPTLSAKSVKNNNIDYSLCYYISSDEYKRFMVRGFPKVGDVLLTTEAPMGMVARLDRDDVGIAQRLLTLRGKEGVLDNEYLLYFLQSSIGQTLLKARETGTTVTGIKQAEFRKIQIDIPQISIQKKIGGFLRVLDKKIEINNKINENLLEQAQAIFAHAFPYTTSDILPKGWRLGTVGEIIEIHDSKRIPLSGAQRDKMKKKIYPYYGAASLMDYVDEYIFDGKYLLLGEDGTVVDNAGFPILQYVWGQFWVNNHAHILTGKLGYSVESLYILFKQTTVKSIVTGAVQPKISQANLKSIAVVIPPANLIEAFNKQVDAMFTLIRNNKEENKRLTALRDGLLPKLMSGELDVSCLDI